MAFKHKVGEKGVHLYAALACSGLLFIPPQTVPACSSLDLGLGQYALNASVVAHSPHQQDG